MRGKHIAGGYFEIEKADNGQYFWRLRAANHERIGWSGETYEQKQHPINMAGQVRALSSTTPIYDRTGG